MPRSIGALMCAALISTWLAAPAQAKAGPCQQETDRFCSDVQPGSGQLMACLEQAPQKDLSSACRAFIVKRERRAGKASWSPRRLACDSDRQALCKGEPRPLDCLLEHRPQLSAACRDSLAPARGSGSMAERRRQNRRAANASLNACGADFVRFCKGGDLPGPCLSRHATELSPACRAVIDRAPR